MDKDDQARLIRVDERTKYLCDRYDEDIPALKKLVQKHETKITVITIITVLLWGATIAFFDGSWEMFFSGHRNDTERSNP